MVTYMVIYKKKSDTIDVDIKEIGTAQKRRPHKPPQQNWESQPHYSACCKHSSKNQAKSKILAKRTKAHTEPRKCSQSQDWFLKYAEKNDVKNRKLKKRDLSSMQEPAPCRPAHLVRMHGKE